MYISKGVHFTPFSFIGEENLGLIAEISKIMHANC
jgi:hypothetical protein